MLVDSFFSYQALILATGIVGGALLSEDGATITAATLAATCMLNAKVAFLSAFVGLWIGDLGVYVLARHIGPSIRSHRWFSLFFGREHREAPSTGRWSLALSRFFPGTRMPSYLSAGLNRMPLPLFAGITATSALVWTASAFALVRLGPARALHLKKGLPLVALMGLIVYFLLRAWRSHGERIRMWLRTRAEHLSQWEFWPAWLFYPPVVLACTALGIRYRGFSLPAVANLNQKNGGIIGESKIEILRELMRTSPEVTAAAYLVPTGPVEERQKKILDLCRLHAIGVPLVLKPDTAQRGAGFKKIGSLGQLEPYLSLVTGPVVLQRYIAHPQEAGIFYYRFPGNTKGQILGITRKEFPVVTGDGIHSLKELIELDPRARMITDTYLNRFRAEANRVLEAAERLRLVEAGNHCQGCEFRDGWDLYTEELRFAFDEISQRLPGFFVGRFDVRYPSDEELRAGTGFQILELNGAASEATNIYDSRNSLWAAYATLFRQWQIVYAIGAANRRRGFRPPSPLSIWRDWRDFTNRACDYPMAD
jgi:membrane protein DedA with SNARE-associated domain